MLIRDVRQLLPDAIGHAPWDARFTPRSRIPTPPGLPPAPREFIRGQRRTQRLDQPRRPAAGGVELTHAQSGLPRLQSRIGGRL